MATIVYFEIPADNVERANKFYRELFGWELKKWEGPMEYWMFETKDNAVVGGGAIIKRMHQEHRVTNYFGVPSVEEYSSKAKKLGGEVLMPKTAVPGMGYFVIIKDTEGNGFGLWETDTSAK